MLNIQKSKYWKKTKTKHIIILLWKQLYNSCSDHFKDCYKDLLNPACLFLNLKLSSCKIFFLNRALKNPNIQQIKH